MPAKSITVFGHIMNHMNISNIDLAGHLHIDASLVSKWKSGARSLSDRSVYFEDTIDFLLAQDESYHYENLKTALQPFFPDHSLTEKEDIAFCLRQVLCGKKTALSVSRQQFSLTDEDAVPTATFSDLSGKRQAMTHLFAYAEQLSVPTDLLLMDSTNFDWVSEDPAFAALFLSKIKLLLKHGFRCCFFIYYDESMESFQRFFRIANALIFKSNIDWFLLPYNNAPLLHFSMTILGQSVSFLGLSTSSSNITTTRYLDQAIVMKHRQIAESILERAHPLFQKQNILEISANIHAAAQFQRSGILYSFLSSPCFLTANSKLLRRILTSNHLSEDAIRQCMLAHQNIRQATRAFFPDERQASASSVIMFLRLEDMVRRTENPPFISRSLSLVCGREIRVTAEQYAAQLRALVKALEEYQNFQIILTTKQEEAPVPSIDCWYMQHIWMLQMTRTRFQFCSDPAIIHVLSGSMAAYIQAIPETRKNKPSVQYWLLDLAEKILLQDTAAAGIGKEQTGKVS